MERPTERSGDAALALRQLEELSVQLGRVCGWNQASAAENARHLAEAATARALASKGLREAGLDAAASRLDEVTLPAPCPLWVVQPARGLEWMSARAAIRAVDQIRAAVSTPGASLPPTEPNWAEHVNQTAVFWLLATLMLAFLALFMVPR